MNKKKSAFASELQRYIRNTQEVRTLSSVNISKLKSGRDYAETLRDNFLCIRTLSEENRRILSEVLDPVLNSEEPLSEEQVAALKEFKQELIDAYTVENLDLPIMAKTVTRLYQDALSKGDLSYMIEQLDAQVEAYYALSGYASRVTSNQSIAMRYVKDGEQASDRFNRLIDKDFFTRIADEESRDLVLINYRYMTAIYEGICNNKAVNDCVFMQFSNALAILEDPFYRDAMPDYNWTYYEMRILEYISTISECDNRRGFSAEQLRFSYKCSERLARNWNRAPELYRPYISAGVKRLYVIRNRYLAGHLDRAAYKKELLRIYAARSDRSYMTDDIYANILVPTEYLCMVRQEELDERERRILLDFYRKLLSYAHNTTNSGELTSILNYYYIFLQKFVEVSDEFTMEDMCLESFAALHPPTYIHSLMVAQLSRCLCRHLIGQRPELFVGVLGCPDVEAVRQRQNDIIARSYHGALMHDVGKLAIIDTVFVYGRKITDEEFQLIRLHPEAGYQLAAEGTSIATYRDIILGHHRFYNGKGGYPQRTDDTPLPDKILIDIVTLADCMDAATDTVGRSYAKGKTMEQFRAELAEGSGTRYSPDVVRLFDDPEVYADLCYLLTEGREKVYADTYYLLKNVQRHGEEWNQSEDPIDAFRAFLKQKSEYETAIDSLNFDLETIAPEKGLTEKADTLAMLSLKLKEHLTSSLAERLFRQLPKITIEDEGLRRSFEILRERFVKQRRIPNDFYEDYAREKALSAKAWERAKETDDFSVFEPYLEKMVTMTQKLCDYTDPDREVYDVLLDKHERGMDLASIDVLFSDMKQGLNRLLRQIEEKPAFDASVLKGEYSIEGQRRLSRILLDYIGFDRNAGVIAESVHPFTVRISCGDIRITNSYRTDDALNAMFSALHEGGHALYEQGIDERYRNTEIERISWTGLHEAQSRFYENLIGRNIAFWKPIYPKVQECLPKFREIDLATFELAINDVHRNLIRIDSDEVTYGLHIIHRYEMEKAIFQDQVPVRELPELWNAKSQELLGLRPKTYADGILQDMHWSDGSFGYFPTYLLGNIYSGMLLKTMERELGPIDAILEQGRIPTITAWLNERIFRHGGMYTAKELIPRICKKEITAEDLLSYFNEKYRRIYRLAP